LNHDHIFNFMTSAMDLLARLSQEVIVSSVTRTVGGRFG